MYHVHLASGGLRRRRATALNLNHQRVIESIVLPWLGGERVLVGGQRFHPAKSDLSIVEGPEVSWLDRHLGRGWHTAQLNGTDVTVHLLETERPESAPGVDTRATPDASSSSFAEDLAVVVTILGGGVAAFAWGLLAGVLMAFAVLAALIVWRRLRSHSHLLLRCRVGLILLASLSLVCGAAGVWLSIDHSGTPKPKRTLDPGLVRLAETRVAYELEANDVALDLALKQRYPQYVITLIQFNAWSTYAQLLGDVLPHPTWDAVDNFYELANQAHANPESLDAQVVRELAHASAQALSAYEYAVR